MSNRYYHCVWDVESSSFKNKGYIDGYKKIRNKIFDAELPHAVVIYSNFYGSVILITNIPDNSKNFESSIRNSLTIYYDLLENHISYLKRKNKHKKAFYLELLLAEIIELLKF